MIDLLQVGDTKPKLPRRRNMSWLAIEQVLRGIAMKFVIVRGDAFGIVLATMKVRPAPAASFQLPPVRSRPWRPDPSHTRRMPG